jgi:hypothetical protein
MPFSRSRSPGVHDPVGQLLVGAEGAGLAQHGVDQGRLAVVDVRHDGHVPDVFAGLHGGTNDRLRSALFQPQPVFRRPIGATFRRHRGQLHRLRPEGEDRRFGLDPDQVARIGPPPDHAAGTSSPAGAGTRPGSPGRVRPVWSSGAARQHDQVRGRAHVGPPRRARARNGGCPTSGRGPTTGCRWRGTTDQSRAHHSRVAQVTASGADGGRARPANDSARAARAGDEHPDMWVTTS